MEAEARHMTRNDQECPGKVMEDKIRTMTTFLDALENSEAIFGLLHKMIYKRYPGQPNYTALCRSPIINSDI